MRSRNPVYPLPQGAFSVHINGDHNHVSRYKSYSWMETGLNRWESFSFGAMPSPNIPDLTKVRQELPFPNNRIGALGPSLYGTIIHAALYGTIIHTALTLLAYLNRICKKNYKYICIYILVKVKIMVNNSDNEIITIIDK